MYTLLVGLMVSVLWLAPVLLEAGEVGRAGEQPPAQARLLTKDQLQKVQERLHAEGLDPGPMTGTMNPQTEAALRQYQQKQGIPVTGAADTATLQRLQVEIPPTGAGEGGTGGR
jgi:peptidoglycan hydrolase-like protein with peptidoglycan-binding domain